MTKKKILCTIISVLLLGTSICSVFAVDTTANLGTAPSPAVAGNMERISAPANFDFEIVSVGRDTVTAEFTSSGRITNPPYVGVKGTKNAAEKVTNLQYVLEYDKEYSFVYTVIEDDIETVYNSFLTIEHEDGIKVVFDEIIKNVIIEDEQRSAGGALEIEPNNSLYSATQTYDDYDNRGAITSTSDVDWWKVSFTQAGRANFWLGNIPAGCDFDISVFNAAGVEIGYSCNNAQEQELVQLDVTPDTYYIKIETYSVVSSSKYLFRVKNYPGKILNNVQLYVQETTETCSCASGRMILSNYGVYVSEADFKEKAQLFAGAEWNYMHAIRTVINYYLGNAGISTTYTADWFGNENDYINCIWENINNNNPVVVNQNINDSLYYPYQQFTDGHYVVVKGVLQDTSTSIYTAFVNDPHYAYSGVYEIPLSRIYYYASIHSSGPFILYVNQ